MILNCSWMLSIYKNIKIRNRITLHSFTRHDFNCFKRKLFNQGRMESLARPKARASGVVLPSLRKNLIVLFNWEVLSSRFTYNWFKPELVLYTIRPSRPSAFFTGQLSQIYPCSSEEPLFGFSSVCLIFHKVDLNKIVPPTIPNMLITYLLW